MKLTILCTLLTINGFLLGCSDTQSRKAVGQNGLLDNGGQITVAIDEAAYNELDKIMRAKDSIGYASMIIDGRAFVVQSPTRVLVLDNTYGLTQVRIKQPGKHLGKSGWVPREWVK